MDKVQIYLLRGICQLPGYVAHEKGFFRDQRVAVEIQIPATAWTVPELLDTSEPRLAVIPWTRVAAAPDQSLVLLCGSGIEEAAIVVRSGLRPADVKSVAVPLAGGIKDLTVMALLDAMGWSEVELRRQPSGDGAILTLLGEGADAASMVEPYATMVVGLGIGKVVKRTGDIWPGAPGCSLTTSVALTRENPDLVQRVVTAYVQGASYAEVHPDEAADIASRYIGVHARCIRDALRVNRPDIQAIRNRDSMEQILSLMHRLDYVRSIPTGYCDPSFLERALQNSEQ